jgi:putative heme iron utilization protein
MSDTLSAEAALAICAHMNDDHAETLAAYARYFGGLQGATSARLVRLDAKGMDLEVEIAGNAGPARIAFDHELADATDARETLIAMARIAEPAAGNADFSP